MSHNIECPACEASDNRCIDSRAARIQGLSTVRRRRICNMCGTRWSTHEIRDIDIEAALGAVNALVKCRGEVARLLNVIDAAAPV